VIDDSVGPFKILEKLGEGGMGAVYKARDLRLNRIVALKVLPIDRRSDPERRQRLLQEARSASAINHPNIVVTYEVGSADGTDYIAMEYIEGRTLKAVGERTGLPLATALRYAADIAGALATAHAAGFIHRDLKPANIMIGDNGVVKILDFGLAKHAASDNTEETLTLAVETREGVIMGSPGYMSPEQINDKKLDARSDIFSFGVLLYEMVTGRRAFRGDSTVATLSAVLRDDPRPPIEVVAGLPAELDRLIRRCLLKDPERRVQCMADLRVTLLELAESGAAEVQRAKPAASKLVWAAIGVGAAGLAIATWIGLHPTGEPDSISLAVPVTGNPGTELGATFSPDGHEVAYPWDGGDEHPGNLDIYIKLLGSGAPLRLTRDPAADFSPAWSPDGRWIAFLRVLGPDKVSLLMIPRLGGPERKIAEFPFATFWLRMQTLDWSADGKYVIAPVRRNTEGPAALYAIPVEGGDMRRLTTPPASATRGDFQPALSPDGREMAFARRSDTVSEIHILKLSAQLMPGDDRVQRTFENRDNGSPAWTANGRELLFTSLLVNGTGTLWRVRARNTEPPRLVTEGATSVAISRDRCRIAFTRHIFQESVWRIDRGVMPKRFIESTRRDWEPRFSPDGRKILFTSDRTGSMQVWIAEADGSNAGQLTSMPASVTGGARLSPDGQTIVFLSNVEGQLEIYSMNVTGGGVRRLTNHPAHDSAPSWSRDGKWIYFASDRKGRYEVWKMPAGGGDPVQVTHHGGFAALESPDGQTLYYSRWVSADGIWRMPVTGGEETRVIPDLWRWGSWDLANNGIYFVPSRGDTIQFYSFAGGKTETLTHLSRPTSFGLTITADGATILYPQVDTDRSELLVSESFR
jgi:Tol biopolymer transport system component/tRNA A-37 threonylcarbamoyl transferase component Bud32